MRFSETLTEPSFSFYGQSTGKGALSLWMHNYNEITIIRDYSSSYYNGPALHVQTGAEGAAAGAYASAQGYTVVAGSCPTVKMVRHLYALIPTRWKESFLMLTHTLIGRRVPWRRRA